MTGFLALFNWMPPGMNVIAEIIVLIGGTWGFFLMLRELLLSRNTRPVGAAPTHTLPADSASPAATHSTHGLDPGLLAVIATACHLVLSRPHRIVSIQSEQSGDDWAGLDLRSWSREGRRDIFTSHQLR